MTSDLKNRVIEALRTIFDPEIPVNIYDMGLIYDVAVNDDAEASIVMTLTSPMCPVAESLPPEVEIKVKQLDGIKSSTVEVTWDPPWDPEMMSEAAKLELGMF